jgi:O-antigen/teichoic acid export membrane protein
MSPAEYSAWILILQMSAYVSYLDLGIQTAIGKFVAEYDAVDNRDATRRMVSTAFSLLSIAAMAGFILVAVLTYLVPHTFRQMPQSLFHDVRLGLLCVGFSICLMLPFSVFGTSFVGLQEYGFVTVLQVGSRVLSALALVAILMHGGTLLQLAWTMAAFNLLTGLLQVVGWHRYASLRVPFAFPVFDKHSMRTLAGYCGILSIWTVGSVLISGLDTYIVGHFDYANTGYYASAASAANFMLMLSSNLLGPLMPAISSLQTQRSPQQLGDLLLRATRFGVVVLLVLGLPLWLFGYPLLTIWLGHAYATRSVVFLQVLVVGNVLRQLGLPYAMFIVATGKQRYATVSPVAESLVNIVLSIELARRYGALGVALGTLLAAFVGLGAHLFISMRYTQKTITISRLRLVFQGVLRPAVSILPTLCILPFWRQLDLWPANPTLLAIWLATTLLLLWRVGLTSAERGEAQQLLRRRFGRLLYSVSG